MAVAYRTQGAITIVAPEGRVDALGAVEMENVLEARVSCHDRRIVVDFVNVRYIGSRGLQALVRALSACRSFGGDLILARVCENVKYILEMIKFDELFSVCDSVDDAIAEFGRVGQCCCATMH